jgi:lipoyl-dependent peroxiredoxin
MELHMSKITKVLATGKTRTTPVDSAIFSGNPEGFLAFHLTTPGNPAGRVLDIQASQPHPLAEQLFAGAWSACYSGAVGLAAKEKKVALPEGTHVEIEVDLGQGRGEYFLQARLTVFAPGADHAAVTEVAHLADAICPYSKAVRGNIDVVLNVVTA